MMHANNLNFQGDLRKQLKKQNEEISIPLEIITNIEMIKFGIKYFLTVILRVSKYRSKLVGPIYNFIETTIKNNVAIAMFVIELFSYDHIIQELLMTVPLITLETSIASLVKTSMVQLYMYEEESISNYVQATLQQDEGSYSLKQPFAKSIENYIGVSTETKGNLNIWVKEEIIPKESEVENMTRKELQGILKGGESEESEEEEEEDSEESKEIEYVQEDDIEAIKKIKTSKKVIFYLILIINLGRESVYCEAR